MIDACDGVDLCLVEMLAKVKIIEYTTRISTIDVMAMVVMHSTHEFVGGSINVCTYL